MTHENDINENGHSEIAGEVTPLLAENGEAIPCVVGTSNLEDQNQNNDMSVSTNTSSDGTEGDELNKPWPATFDRSISILAVPTINKKFIEQATKSPKITPGFSRRARRGNLDRGYHTPDLPKPPIGGGHFKKGLKKFQSLDFSKKQDGAHGNDSCILEQERRALEAKAYRQKLLKKSGGTGIAKDRDTDEETAATYSPGYQREKISDDYKKQQKIEEKQSNRDTATFSQCVFNMANVLLGIGMLGLPYMCKRSGWIGGFFVLFTFGATTYYTSLLIGRELNGDPRPTYLFDDNPYKSPTVPGSSANARMRQPIKTFPDIARAAFGQRGNIILSIILYFELFACICVCLLAMGDHMYTLYPEISRNHHLCGMAIASSIPTALLRTPRLLSYLSFVGTFASVFVVFTISTLALKEGDISEIVAEEQHLDVQPPYHTLWDPSGLPIAFGLIAYTFSGHALVPSIYSSMERPQDFDKMITCTYLVVTTCCIVVLVSGYYMFGTTVLDQVTISLENADLGAAGASTSMLTWLIILASFSKYTLSMFPLALGIEEIVAPCIPSDRIMEIVSSLIKLVLIVLSLLVAMYVPSFSFICSLVGLVCTMTVSCIFPAAAHLKLFGPNLSFLEKALDWIFIIFGSFMAIAGTIATI
eukprot:CAMPEP_0197831640 /NCGR_PEP_ID=MMETSP1437-20131217/11382_1 /TAXON_ID=49252 ORGANISM="Eucampia antarctica, Strain CCMP1452" /NCGR_SAMPLE_ID=MMETSP1437 /ASSEMBLY_ACC=CAM_ASM_001096 /LENGTH=645 /DNA_ID=CAMNT_0043434651 /DNA_START=52 /DNA_END=1989 /DNA_ORIENTATION=-